MIKFESYEDFLNKLEENTGCQVYDERTDSTGVEAPYIVCQRMSNNDFLADNTRWMKRDSIVINLHTYQENHIVKGQRHQTEVVVETYLDNCGFIFDRDTDWLEDIDLYRTIYGIEVWYED